MLIDVLETQISAQNVDQIILYVQNNNLVAIKFYHSHGFIHTGVELDEVYHEDKIVDLQMVKSI